MENKQEYEQYGMLSKGAQAELVEKKSIFYYACIFGGRELLLLKK
ncbi:MAG: hypothetical protein ACLS9K_12735 [Lachnospira eligens]